MKILPHQIQFSEQDADLRKWTWCISNRGYLKCGRWKSGKPITILAHRIVVARMIGRNLNKSDICDHINRDRLDNRRENLRLVDSFGNAQNSKLRKDNTSGYRGVSFEKKQKRWQAQVGSKSGRIIRRFRTMKEAIDFVDNCRRNLGYLSDG